MKLRIYDLAFEYPGVRVLSNVTCTIDPGTLVAVVGTNGAGKSTFIKCLNRILEPRGTVMLDGTNLRTLGCRDIAKQMAYLSQKVGAGVPHQCLRCGAGRTLPAPPMVPEALG